MTKPAMIRQIFIELRHSLGNETSTSDLLELASLIADTNEPEVFAGGAYLSDGRTALCDLPIHQVMETWPWEVVSDEFKSMNTYYSNREDDYMGHVPQDFLYQELLAA